MTLTLVFDNFDDFQEDEFNIKFSLKQKIKQKKAMYHLVINVIYWNSDNLFSRIEPIESNLTKWNKISAYQMP